MDGVLVSSLGSVERSWAKWGAMRNVDGALAIKTAHGQRAIETVRKLRPDLNDVEELKLIEEIEIADKDDIEVLRGVQGILAALPKNIGPLSPRPPKSSPARGLAMRVLLF